MADKIRQFILMAGEGGAIQKYATGPGETWATCRDASSGSIIWTPPASGNYLIMAVGGYVTSQDRFYISRIGLSFDTRMLPADATIGSAKIRKGMRLTYNGGSPDENYYYLVEGNHSSPLVGTDYGSMLSQDEKGGVIGDEIETEYTWTELSESAEAWIKKADYTLFGIRTLADIDNIEPTTSHNYAIYGYAGASNPMSVQTYQPVRVGADSVKLIGHINERDKGIYLEIHYTEGTETDPIYPRYRFAYHEIGESWSYSDWQDSLVLPTNMYETISGLTSGTDYEYKIQYETPETGVQDGNVVQFNFSNMPILILEIAFEQSILSEDPVWTDVTSYLMKLHTKRGRNHELDRCDAGTATFILNNATGDWWRYNTNGAFFGVAGGVKPLTLIRLSFEYDTFWYELFYGVIESFKPGWLTKGTGHHPVMECKAVDVFKSFTRYKIVDANPEITQDATAGLDYVYVDDVRGLVEEQSIKIYDDNHEQITIISQITPSLNLVFFDDVLAYNFGAGSHLKKFPSVLSGRRIQDILLEVKWPSALMEIDDGQYMMVELSPGTGGDNAMDELYKTTEAEGGNLFISREGKATFQDAIAMTKSPYNTSQATFKDDGTSSKFYDPELSDDDEFIYNESNISGDAIGEQIMIDSDAQLEQGPRSLDHKDSRLVDPDDAFDQATINVERYKESIQRCSGLIIRPEGDPYDSWPKVLGLDLGTRITLQLNSTRNPAMINIDRHIMGISHDWSVREPWETRWQLWDVNRSYVFRSQHEGWLDNYWPEPYTYTDIHDDLTAAAAHNDEEYPALEIGQWPYIAFSYNEKIRRGQIEFDTSDLDAGWTIESAQIILMLKPQLTIMSRKSFDLCIVGTYNSNQPVVVADFGNMLGQTEIYGSVTVPATFLEADPFHPVGVYMIVAIELSAAGIAHINKGGTSRFWLRSDNDINSVEPTDEEGEWVLIEGHLGAFPPRLLVKLA